MRPPNAIARPSTPAAAGRAADASLYGVTVLIWGSTFFAITFQLGPVAASWSVVWRFALAACVLLLYSMFAGRRLRFGWRDHSGMALQGALLFSTNYYVSYLAIALLPSGLVAVAFSTVQIMNVAFGALFFRQPIRPSALIGGIIGIAGLALIFRPQLVAFDLADAGSLGLVLALAATLIAALGNMAAVANQRRGIPVVESNAFSMTYGALLVALFAGAQAVLFGGPPPAFEVSGAYVGSLAYLALFGTVFGFGAYLTLVGRIGADRAGYAMVLFPVIALAISTLFEGYVWSPTAGLGVALVLVGNVAVMGRRAPAASPRPPTPPRC